MKDSEKDKTMLDFLNRCPLAVLSTLNKENKPESAVIAFCETESFDIIFECFKDSRKYSNLKSNKHVSLTTGFSAKKHITFQYEGVAEEQHGKDIENCKNLFKNKDTPCSEEFLENPKAIFFKIKPKWIRYSDYTAKPPIIIEKNFKHFEKKRKG